MNVFRSTERLVNYDGHYVTKIIVMWSYVNYKRSINCIFGGVGEGR